MADCSNHKMEPILGEASLPVRVAVRNRLNDGRSWMQHFAGTEHTIEGCRSCWQAQVRSGDRVAGPYEVDVPQWKAAAS